MRKMIKSEDATSISELVENNSVTMTFPTSYLVDAVFSAVSEIHTKKRNLYINVRCHCLPVCLSATADQPWQMR